MQYDHCPESRRSAHGRLSIQYCYSNLDLCHSLCPYREVVCWLEGPLWEVPLHSYSASARTHRQDCEYGISD